MQICVQRNDGIRFFLEFGIFMFIELVFEVVAHKLECRISHRRIQYDVALDSSDFHLHMTVVYVFYLLVYIFKGIGIGIFTAN